MARRVRATYRGTCWNRCPHSRLKEHGLPDESETSIKAKLKRGTFAATFLLATLGALELEGVRLEDV